MTTTADVPVAPAGPIVKSEPKPMVGIGDSGLMPKNIEELYRAAQLFASSDLVPKDFQGKPANCVVAIQAGMELGLPPFQALQGIAVINGRPSLWGDALLAVVRSSPLCEGIEETYEGEGDKLTARCVVKRRGQAAPIVSTFSVADAKAAGLWSKAGPWTSYPKRMLKMRARAFALRDGFADVLKGVAVAEEQQDIVDTTARVVENQAAPKPSPADAVRKALGIAPPEPAPKVEQPEPEPETFAEKPAPVTEPESLLPVADEPAPVKRTTRH